ncbi:flagellar basal body protein [Campylobacter jejuni]
MMNSVYSGFSGVKSLRFRNDITANNIANLNS